MPAPSNDLYADWAKWVAWADLDVKNLVEAHREAEQFMEARQTGWLPFETPRPKPGDEFDDDGSSERGGPD